ncbi:MAG: tetratricopeptide repeat protein [Elusimicrobiota bacterium]
MEGETNFTKIFIIFFIFIGSIVYIRANYTMMNVLEVSEKRPHPTFSPKIEYYIGRAQYHRDIYAESHQAFDQLLKDYPTCQYAPDALYFKGLMYSEEKKYGPAREVYEQYIEKFPKGDRIQLVEKKYEFIKFK